MHPTSIIRTPSWSLPSSSFIVCRTSRAPVDLPQVAAALDGKRLTLLDPVDAMKSRVDLETTRKLYEPPVQVATRKQELSLAEQYLELLG